MTVIQTQPTSPKKILIIRLSAIGDVVMASGLIPSLKKAYPDASLTWLVEPMAADLLKENDALDEVILWPKAQWKQLFKEKKYRELFRVVREFVRMLRAKKFDLALDTQGLIKSAIWAKLSGAKRRIGLDSREGSNRLVTETLTIDRDHPHISSEYRQLAEHLGAKPDWYRMSLPFSSKTHQQVQHYLSEAGIQGDYYVICPYTTRPQKHWFDDYWLSLAKQLAENDGLPILVLGGPGDQSNAALLCEQSEGALMNFAGKTRLLEAVALLDQAKGVIGVDTGLTHMSIARRTPTVALFGSTRPYLNTMQDNATVIYHRYECSPCHRRPTCDGRFDCLREIKPEEVLQVLQDVQQQKATQ
ncbi:glycosyltransferase family 9 protein [Algicola sagamiensis]|uniref:glycosyltransferase family 9 protein n=1 Tax=Algicola sagamiensis TaxID=163869 RepID=UPI00037BF65E|nr:glycosyltransferase family 9 protein [Algicola sagamiensis]